MEKAGFRNSAADPCLSYRKCNEKRLHVAIYVDHDLIVGSNEEEITAFLNTLQCEFDITFGTLDSFLDIKIKQNENGAIMISQEKYTKEILERFRMAESNMNSTPIGYEENDQNETEAISSSVPYSEAIGCLMYLSIATRPDIRFAVSKASRAMRKPTASDWNRVQRIFRYL
ncbi:uncharacterized mitochondrial protein AtMg00810-like [Schistocerca piceifrons]|uniref:uncharacterized mitochondrial protein AtMg00810-like n=1 Tax=Schistocerca piceifrons TaxID=274613 RepID=UPI001F5EEF6A|nr:uncharacterized mitochondrial protein AtMg00810-like [Schistocerca piceifrons]